MTTPFELRLESELNTEFARFANKWLFPWHSINIENRTVDVDDFQGGRIQVGGIVFQGQIQTIYWQSVGRYLNQKIHSVFEEWDMVSKSYSPEVKRVSADGIERLLRFFVARVVKQATDTDRTLRGRGHPESVDAYNSTGTHSGANATIHRLKEAHLRLVIGPTNEFATPPAEKNIHQRLERWISDNKFLTWCVGIAIAIAGLAKAFLF